MSKTRVLICDDHPLLRRGLRYLVSAQADMEVVGEAGDLRAAAQEAARLKPDVATLDLSMPGGTGVSGIERVRKASPGTRVLVVSMHDDPAYVRAALAMGAAGYVVKSAADAELVTAIRSVRAGRLFVDARGVEGVGSAGFGDVGMTGPRGAVAGPGESPIAQLSEREREVLVGVAQGHTSAAMADRLGLSVKTVESYRARMMQKLNLRSRADVVRLAMESGLLGTAPPDTTSSGA